MTKRWARHIPRPTNSHRCFLLHFVLPAQIEYRAWLAENPSATADDAEEQTWTVAEAHVPIRYAMLDALATAHPHWRKDEGWDYGDDRYGIIQHHAYNAIRSDLMNYCPSN